MPYFSFSLNDNFKLKDLNGIITHPNKIKKNIKFFSKNTSLWRLLNKKKLTNKINFVKFEKRKKVSNIKNKILFCLPPSIGLGDSIEYALSIKAIIDQRSYTKVGIAYIGRYYEIFKRYFKIKNLHEDVIDEKKMNQYDTLFHFTLEINEFLFQKYNRSDIEFLITKYFNVKLLRNFNFVNNSKKKYIKKLTFFPISKSPIRTLRRDIIDSLINHYSDKYEIEIIFDKQSSISNMIDSQIQCSKIKKLYPENLNDLLNIIENINFGIFIDSGPLHVAKILRKKGVFISTSVGANILLNDFHTIAEVKNYYASAFCKSPCGLTNIFSYNNKYGCYETLRVRKEEIMKIDKLNNLQRGQVKTNYIKFVDNPVGCQNNINFNMIKDVINKNLSN